MRVRRPLLAALASGALLSTAIHLTGPASASGASSPGAGASHASSHASSTGPDRVLEKYAADTWKSMDAMTVPATGLPADNIGGDLEPASRSGYTSPTNIGSYLWSTVAARDTGLISRAEARRRMATTIGSVAKLERHDGSGMFYNWYDPVTLEKLRTWPENGSTVKPFLSSVDNGWLATGLLLAARAEPSLADQADRIRKDMDFGCYYDPAENQIRGGFWDENPHEDAPVPGDYCDLGTDVWYTGHHYGAFNTEPRMASYLGIAAGQIPTKHYYGTFRTFPNDNCDWSWTETRPTGAWKTYDGVRVFEGALPYRGMDIVPTWGGSMFEALMVPLFVPEETVGPALVGPQPPALREGPDRARDEGGRLRLLGLLPVQRPRRRLPRVRRGPARHGRARLHLRRGAHHRGPALRRLP